MNPDLVRIAFAGLAPRSVDRLFARHVSGHRVVAAVEGRRTALNESGVAAVSVDADTRLTELASIGVTLVGRDEDEYPSRLLRYPDAPRWLFMRGRDVRGPAIGIVGTRTCTTYGTDLAFRYGTAAAKAGWSVVSGLARGIDGAAQRGSVSAGGHCHAVLGSGIDIVYPRSNRDPYHEILDAGGVVSSEYPPGTPPEAWRFPTRNHTNISQAHLVGWFACRLRRNWPPCRGWSVTGKGGRVVAPFHTMPTVSPTGDLKPRNPAGHVPVR